MELRNIDLSEYITEEYNRLIAGYFALSKLEKEMSFATILIPIANLVVLLYIEYKMMERNRFELEITKKRLTK